MTRMLRTSITAVLIGASIAILQVAPVLAGKYVP
jgi:hypothetical protein